ncbi:MAG: hypothetical protein TU36_001795 [Vulcanisaeta sp. AZ3]|jgi:hypothetical protein|nr:MAG: hypothetical protein TU36_06680 [Vulcanisaeta sp. AZ3]
MPRKLIPIVPKPSVRPLKYYDIVGDLMMNFLIGRRITIIRQTGDSITVMTRIKHEDGSKLPIIISDKNELLRFVKIGGIDFMASVSSATAKDADTVIIDVKGSRKAWIINRGLELMDLITSAIRTALEYLGLMNSLVFFDGMNGFKIMAFLSGGISAEELRVLINIISDAVIRSIKSNELYQALGDEALIGGNTMLKVKMFRIPYSLHWSTKLSAIPIPRIYDFTTISADPANVIRHLDTDRKLLEKSLVKNPIDSLIENVRRVMDGDYSLIYELKGAIKSKIMKTEINNFDKENLKTL